MAKLPPQPVGVPPGSSYWNDWYEKLRFLIEQATTAVIKFIDLDFTGSNLTSIATRNHNDLQNIQGGAAGEYNHLTNAQVTAIGSIPSSDNPAATIGLAAINGSASTYMRSDAAPALSQGITPTWTATHTFSKSGGGTSAATLLSSAAPATAWTETDAAADNKLWDLLANGEQLVGRVVNDANSIANNWLTVDRTGTTVDSVTFTGQVISASSGKGLSVKEGANCKQGTATLVAGAVTVANTSVTANSRIFLTSQVDGGTPGFLRVSARVVGTSFTITSSNAADTSTVAYEIFEPS